MTEPFIRPGAATVALSATERLTATLEAVVVEIVGVNARLTALEQTVARLSEREPDGLEELEASLEEPRVFPFDVTQRQDGITEERYGDRWVSFACAVCHTQSAPHQSCRCGQNVSPKASVDQPPSSSPGIDPPAVARPVNDERSYLGQPGTVEGCPHSAQDWYREISTGRLGCNECDETAQIDIHTPVVSTCPHCDGPLHVGQDRPCRDCGHGRAAHGRGGWKCVKASCRCESFREPR